MAPKVRMTQEEKDAAAAKAKAVREFTGSTALPVIEEFKGEWQRLEKIQKGLISECGRIVMDMASILEIEPSENGKSMLIATIRACIGNEGTLMQYARKWSAIALGLLKQDGEPIKVTDKNGNVTAYATVSTLSELNAVSQAANALLGIKPRGKREKAKPQAQPVQKAEVWPLLVQILESQAGRAEMRRFLNQHGFEMVALDAAKQAETRKLRKAA